MPCPSASVIREERCPVSYMVSVWRFFELIGIVTFIWLMGVVGLSVLVVHVCVFVYVIVEWFVSRNQHLIGITQIDHKKNRLFTQSAAWFNKLIAQMWPSLSEHIENAIKSRESQIRQSLPPGMKTFKFINVHMGNKPPIFQAVKVYPQHRWDRIFMDLLLDYSIGSDIRIYVNQCAVSVKNLTIKSPLRLVLKCDDRGWPYLLWAVVFFVDEPDLKFELENCDESVDILCLKNSLRKIILSQITEIMVLPNQIPVYVSPEQDENLIKTAEPEGVVRVQIAGSLDTIQSSRLKSSSIIVSKLGKKSSSFTINHDSTDQQFNQTFDFVVDSTEAQELLLDVYDIRDDKACFVGKVELPLAGVTKSDLTEDSYELKEASDCNVHIKKAMVLVVNKS